MLRSSRKSAKSGRTAVLVAHNISRLHAEIISEKLCANCWHYAPKRKTKEAEDSSGHDQFSVG